MANIANYCPTCGKPQEITHSPEWLLTHFDETNFSKMLAELIRARRDREAVSNRALCVIVGGEYTPATKNVVNVCLSQTRHRLWELGWDIVGPAITQTGYYLVPLDREF